MKEVDFKIRQQEDKQGNLQAREQKKLVNTFYPVCTKSRGSKDQPVPGTIHPCPDHPVQGIYTPAQA